MSIEQSELDARNEIMDLWAMLDEMVVEAEQILEHGHAKRNSVEGPDAKGYLEENLPSLKRIQAFVDSHFHGLVKLVKDV